MIGFGPAHRYYLYRPPTDMRKSFDGLSGLVRSGLKHDPLSGDVFVFVNRRRTHLKLLLFERGGFVLYYKRLEQGTFELPATGETGSSERLSWPKLMLMLEGIAIESVRYRKRYTRPEKAPLVAH